MRRISFLLLLLVVFFVPVLASASHFGDFHVIPIAGRGPGAAGSMWQTDVLIHNFGTVPLTVEIGIVESGLGQSDNLFPVMVDGATTFTVAPAATRLLADLLRDHRGRPSTTGALLIGGDHSFAVSSRVYHVDAGGAAIGQTVPSTEEFLSSVTEVAVIPGLTANTNFRSNAGFVAAASGGAPLVVEVGLLGPAGTSLGATTFTIAPGTMSHMQLSTTAITSASFDLATATLRIVSGSGNVTGYGAVIDNRSNHAAFISSGFSDPATNSAQSILASFLGTLRQRD